MEINLYNYFANTKVSFVELLKMPEGFQKVHTSKEGEEYFTNKNETSVIRISSHWGKLPQNCYWLLAGSAKQNSEKAIGYAKFSDFEEFKNYSWNSFRELFQILPEKMEIVWVWKSRALRRIEEKSIESFDTMSRYGHLNSQIGWALCNGKPMDISGLIITGEDEFDLKIKGVHIPTFCSRETIVFALLMSKTTGIFEIIQTNLDDFPSEFFKELFQKSGVVFLSKKNSLIFKIKDEEIEIKFREKRTQKEPFSTLVDKMRFI